MKTLIKIFTILFLLTITVNSVDAKPKHKKGGIENHNKNQNKLSKKALKAWKIMCKINDKRNRKSKSFNLKNELNKMKDKRRNKISKRRIKRNKRR
jgi:hypothetical protein